MYGLLFFRRVCRCVYDSKVAESMSNGPDLVVFGKAYPKGSKTMMRGRMIDGGPRSHHSDDDERKRRNREARKWPTVVERAAADAYEGAPTHRGPVNLCAVFYLPHPKTGKQRTWCVSPPDLDKLLRAVCDPLTLARIWADDSRVVSFYGSAKKYAKKGAPIGHPDGPRVEITVTAVTE